MAVEYNSEKAPEMESEAGETVDIPLSMLAGKTVSPGDVVRLEVVSNNEDSGTVTVKYATEKKMEGGIDEAMKAFEA